DYLELRSQTNMLHVQERIAEIENQIADRREFYNEAVTRHNTRIRQFPYLLIANPLGFSSYELWEATEADRRDVDVSAAFGA
ncbi:MAG: LemA family protein, partial [Halobacteriota archaeon]